MTVLCAFVALAGCAGDSGSTTESNPVTTVAASSASTPPVASTTVEATTSTSSEAPVESMRSKRYCEVLLLSPTANGIEATVYNSFPMGDCPDEQWRELDGVAIAAEQGAALALLNGPRYWLMDEVFRDQSDVVSSTFGRIEMNRYATVTITDPTSIGQRYTPQTVDRQSTFTFRAGRTIFRLLADDGRIFVMQSWSQQVDAQLTEGDLVDLAGRLQLPDGWTYESVTLTADLVIGASREPAQVLQDEFLNSYSLVD